MSVVAPDTEIELVENSTPTNRSDEPECVRTLFPVMVKDEARRIDEHHTPFTDVMLTALLKRTVKVDTELPPKLIVLPPEESTRPPEIVNALLVSTPDCT